MTIGIGPSGALLHTIGIGIEIGLGIGIGQWKHTIRLCCSVTRRMILHVFCAMSAFKHIWLYRVIYFAKNKTMIA